jgi:AcrR family transcriptional regulator
MPRPRTVDDAAILAAAAEAIGEVGPSGLTLAAVGEKVGLTAPTLMQRFGSKRGLLLALAEAGGDWAPQKFRDAMQRYPSPLKALVSALREMTAGVSSPEAMANNLAFLQLDLRDPEFHQPAHAQARRVRDSIAALLSDAVVAGELEPDTDTARLAEAIEAVYNGALVTWAVHRRGAVDRWVGRQVETVLAPHRIAA